MAYPNCTINEGTNGSFLASEAIGLYDRVKFVTGSSPDGKPSLALAGATDRAIGVAMQPIASGAYGTIRFLNAPGEQFGNCVGTVALAALIYAAASGDVSGSSAGGALLIGQATTAGYDGGPITYMQFPAGA